MYEIELKAHVINYDKTKKTIESFASCIGEKNKSDVYWSIINPSSNTVRVRIREEKSKLSNGEKKESTIVTYKRKELRQTRELVSYEVNDEQEFCIDNRKAFETVLIDTGYKTYLIKEKHVLQWEYNGVLIELCTIGGLGDFLELEITTESQDESTVEQSLKKLQQTLLKCNIPLEKIEKRYYSELLREKDSRVLE